MATDLEIQFQNKVDELLALRERKLSGEKLTTQQYTELGLYRDLLNEYVQNQRKEDRLLSISAAKESVAAARDLQAAETKRLQVEFAAAAERFTAITSGNAPLVPVEVVDQKTPEKPVVNETVIDPSNFNKTIRDIQVAGKNIEEGTKTQEFSKLEGTFNEFSNAPLFIETIKNTIAQAVEPIPVAVTEPVPPTVNPDAGFSIASIETLKSDVSQILQTGEREIVRTVELDIFNANVYGTDVETGIRAVSIKQDTLDPTVELIRTAQNPFTVTQAQLAAQSIALLTQQELAAEIAQFEQVELREEQASAVESFTGGG
jgi:hypothetical protein